MGWRIAVSLYYQFIKKAQRIGLYVKLPVNHNAANLNINILKLFDGCSY